MKKVLFVLLFLVGAFSLSAQSMGDSFYTDTITFAGKQNYRILQNTLRNTFEPKYKLYKTENMWTFLELNTCNGEVYKVQWSTQSGNSQRFWKFIGGPDNMGDTKYSDYYPGRFELYSTDNMYNFILLDSYSGRTWQVQWGMNSNENIIIPIEKY